MSDDTFNSSPQVSLRSAPVGAQSCCAPPANAARCGRSKTAPLRLGACVFALVLAPLCVAAEPRSTEETLARPLVTGRHGVVTSLHPLSSMAGMQMLLKGGNAFDAAVATAIASTVVDPKDSSIGGQGFATIYSAKEKRVRVLNFFGPSPRAATIEAVQGRDYQHGYLSPVLPSCLAGYAELHRRYGRLPWRDVVQPALELAEQGFAVTEELAGILRVMRAAMDFPSTQRVFFPGGRAPEVGENFRQPDLARTLRAVAEHGADAFYRGDLAQRIGKFFQENGGLITADDLANYRPDWVEPLTINYRGYDVYTVPPNGSGLALLLQLNILEGFDLAQLGHNSPDYLNLVADVQRIGVGDRNRYVADPEVVAVPVERLLSDDYAAERRKLIQLGRAMPSVPAPLFEQGAALDTPRRTAPPLSRGDLGPAQPQQDALPDGARSVAARASADAPLARGEPDMSAEGLAQAEGRGGWAISDADAANALRFEPPQRSNTTHLSVVDAEGNMVSLTQTLGAWFGSGVVAADTGVLFSNQMRHLHTVPESPSKLGPGRRPRSNQAPVIVLKDGEPVLALGTPGTEGIWQRVVQVLVNIIDFKMDVQRAVAAPRILHGGPSRVVLDPPPLVKFEDRIPRETAEALRARGYTLNVIPDDEGSVNGVQRDPQTGLLYGGADPRRWGHEPGWWGPANSVYAIGW